MLKTFRVNLFEVYSLSFCSKISISPHSTFSLKIVHRPSKPQATLKYGILKCSIASFRIKQKIQFKTLIKLRVLEQQRQPSLAYACVNVEVAGERNRQDKIGLIQLSAHMNKA